MAPLFLPSSYSYHFEARQLLWLSLRHRSIDAHNSSAHATVP